MRIVCQIGYVKALGGRKEGQKIRVYINDIECTWDDRDGQFLTTFLDTQKGRLWYLWQGDLEQNDSILISVSTGIRGAGQDERRTFEAVYVVDGETDVQELSIPGVGRQGYPLLKGRFREIGSVSEEDKREVDIEAFLDDEAF